ncbi:MAG TPA: carboxypeptidase-like regulatory domain-containing protein [Blastocatellia bacterium]|nr:carboxypeptidase-like regulatory domain-containing protein [Blastocatellia bacterium]
MRQATKLCAAIAIVLIGYGYVPANPAGRGSIRGVVFDGVGSPLLGVVVMILAESEEAKGDKVVKRADTDADGKFVATGIIPGRYRIKAQAEGFTPVELAADVRPNKVTVFDSILLRRVTMLSDETKLNTDPKYASRRSRGTIFQLDQDKDAPVTTGDMPVALTDRTSELHGGVQTFAQGTTGGREARSSFVGANFAVSQLIANSANLVVSGQAGYGAGAPQSLRAIATANLGDRHRVSVALGYGRFTFSRHAAMPRLGQFSVAATDTWQVSGPVLIVYGLELARFTESSSGTSVLPRFGVAVDAGSRTRLFANIISGSSSDTQSTINLESGEVEFSESKPAPIAHTPGDESAHPVMDRSYRLEFGGEQILSDKSSIEMMAFFDTVSGHGVGLLAIPNEGSANNAALRTEDQSGRARGVRVVYHRRVNKVIEGSVGYAFGEGQQLDRRGINEPGNLFSNGLFHVFSARVDANFVSTGTRVSTVLRLAPTQAVFAIDPFQGQTSTFDPNVSVSLTQDLPNFSFIPGQWAALIDLRNLLDQQGSVSDDRQELVASRFHRLVRVGVSLRF